MRRDTFLKTALLAAAGAPVLAACSGGADPSTGTGAGSPSPLAAGSAPGKPFTTLGGSELPDYATVHRILDGDDPVTWVCTGDSITQGAHFTNGWRHYVQHFEERIRWELGRKWDFVINTGISAERSGHILDDFDNRVGRFGPAVVSVMIGTNDSVDGKAGRKPFRANVTALVDRIRDLGAVPLLLTFNPIGSAGDPRRADLPAYARIVREIATDRQVVLSDNYAAWDALDPAVTDAWHGDAIHPNAIGHLVMARQLFTDLGIADPDSNTGRLWIETP